MFLTCKKIDFANSYSQIIELSTGHIKIFTTIKNTKSINARKLSILLALKTICKNYLLSCDFSHKGSFGFPAIIATLPDLGSNASSI